MAIATQASDQIAYNLMKGPGYMAVTAGEVIHIVKCTPVEVQAKQEKNCYSELRVKRKNETYYLTPRTHVLKSHGTRIPCNKILLAQYYIDSEWYKITPALREAKPPTTIQPLKKPTWRYVNPSHLATSGIYSNQDIEDLRESLMFPVERPALLNDIAREMHGQPVDDNDGNILKLLNENAVDKIMESAWTKHGLDLWRLEQQVPDLSLYELLYKG